MIKEIENIFSTKERVNEIKQKYKVVVDIHEKNSLVAAELHNLGAEIQFQYLKVADYLVNNVAIERKTVNDFIASMLNKRLIKQLEELQQYEKRLLIIEGLEEQELYAEEREGMIHPNAIRGFLLSIVLRYNTPIIFSKDYRDTAIFIHLIGKKKQTEQGINPKKKSLSVHEQLQFIIEGFPGIGPKSAKKLLKHFHTIKNIINADEEQLKKILGKKARIFKELIESGY